jgi:hypothetical protein
MNDFQSAFLVESQAKASPSITCIAREKDANPPKPQSQKQVRTCIDQRLAAPVCLASIKVSPYPILTRPSAVKIDKGFPNAD